MLTHDLTDLGLSDKEAKIYLTLLELEVASVGEIAKASGVNRSSTYVTLESLKKRGLVSTTGEEPVARFVATSPDILLRSVENTAMKEQHKLERVKNLIPELKGLYKETKSRPKVRVFEGKEGLILALSEELENNKEKVVRAFSSGENILKLIQEEIMVWTKVRAQRGIRFNAIYVENKATRFLHDSYSEISRVVFVSKKNYISPVDMMIWGDKVGYLTINKGNITTIIIEGKEIETIMKGMFELAFDEARKRGGKYEENLK